MTVTEPALRLPHRVGTPQGETLEDIRSGRFGRVHDAGPGRVKELDTLAYEQFERQNGRGSIRTLARARKLGLRSLEADWVAAEEGLAYVLPHLGFLCGWEWTQLTLSSRQVKRAGRAVLTFTAQEGRLGPAGRYDMQLSHPGMENLVTIAHYYGTIVSW